MKNYRPYSGKRKHTARNVIVTILAVALFCFFGLLTAVLGGSFDHLEGNPEIMLILGCQVKSWGPSILLQDRLEEAVDYLSDHTDMVVVVTGGQGSDEPSTEARAMANYLLERGIDESQILLEERSTSTLENLCYSLELLEEKGYNTSADILVISNGFHLTRVRMLWERVYEGEGVLSTLAAPSSHMPSRLKMYIREPLALVKSCLVDFP